MKTQLYRYGNPGDRYGEANFIPISYDDIKNNPSFQAADRDIRNGQYKHFISRVSNPIYSVHYYTTGGAYSFKVLYEGSGGGLMLLIADVGLPPAYAVTIRSFVAIAVTKLIPYCLDYDLSPVCIRCIDGYHLENGLCYQNTGACIKYYGSICI